MSKKGFFVCNFVEKLKLLTIKRESQEQQRLYKYDLKRFFPEIFA